MADIDLGKGGAFGSLLTVFADLVFNSGELLGLLVSLLVENIDVLLPMLSTLRSQIAPQVDAVPTDAFDKLVFAVAVLFVLVMASRLVKRAIQRLR